MTQATSQGATRCAATAAAAAATAAIPLPATHIRRTSSEVRLCDEMEAAEWRERAMFRRLVDGMRRRRDQHSLLLCQHCRANALELAAGDVRGQGQWDDMLVDGDGDGDGDGDAAVFGDALRSHDERRQQHRRLADVLAGVAAVDDDNDDNDDWSIEGLDLDLDDDCAYANRSSFHQDDHDDNDDISGFFSSRNLLLSPPPPPRLTPLTQQPQQLATMRLGRPFSSRSSSSSSSSSSSLASCSSSTVAPLPECSACANPIHTFQNLQLQEDKFLPSFLAFADDAVPKFNTTNTNANDNNNNNNTTRHDYTDLESEQDDDDMVFTMDL